MFLFRVYNSMVCGVQTRVLPIRYDMIIRCVLSVGDVCFFSLSSFHFLHFIFNTVRSTVRLCLVLRVHSLSLVVVVAFFSSFFFSPALVLLCLPFK